MYNGEYVLMSRLKECIDSARWNKKYIKLDDVIKALDCNIKEQIEQFGDNNNNIPPTDKSDKYHLGRIIYFINHPEEIRDISIDNACNGFDIYPIPIIDDGNHRYMAALYLHSIGKLEKLHCRYGGRQDLLRWLKGKRKRQPIE